MMKSVMIFLFCFMLGFRPLIPVADYLINYDYYSKVLCINQNKPELHCNGKCQLAKEMAEKSDENKNAKTGSLPSIDVFVPHETVNLPKKKTVLAQAQKKFFTKQLLYSFIFQQINLKPPIV